MKTISLPRRCLTWDTKQYIHMFNTSECKLAYCNCTLNIIDKRPNYTSPKLKVGQTGPELVCCLGQTRIEKQLLFSFRSLLISTLSRIGMIWGLQFETIHHSTTEICGRRLKSPDALQRNLRMAPVHGVTIGQFAKSTGRIRRNINWTTSIGSSPVILSLICRSTKSPW